MVSRGDGAIPAARAIVTAGAQMVTDITGSAPEDGVGVLLSRPCRTAPISQDGTVGAVVGRPPVADGPRSGSRVGAALPLHSAFLQAPWSGQPVPGGIFCHKYG